MDMRGEARRADLRRRLRTYLITDPDLCAEDELERRVMAAVKGGATLVQLRDKTATTPERIKRARGLIAVLEGSGVPVIVNDDVEAAIGSGAAGVHIGQGDGDVRAVRARIGPSMLIGLSCETLAHVAALPADCVDYLGLGPVFATSTKPGHAAPVGLGGLAKMAAATTLPTAAIGGLSAGDVPAIRAAGCDGVAVVSALIGALDPFAAAREFAAAWREERPE